MSKAPLQSGSARLDCLYKLLIRLNIIKDRWKNPNPTKMQILVQVQEELAYVNRIVEKAKTKSNR